MNVIGMTRELGKLIQQDERYIAYQKAKVANDADKNLQQLIAEFNLQRMNLNREMSNPEKSAERMNELDDKIKSLYGEIMANENMAAFNNAKLEMDDMLSQINMVITASANGEDPATCPTEAPHSCSGSCSTCGGCH